MWLYLKWKPCITYAQGDLLIQFWTFICCCNCVQYVLCERTCRAINSSGGIDNKNNSKDILSVHAVLVLEQKLHQFVIVGDRCVHIWQM